MKKILLLFAIFAFAISYNSYSQQWEPVDLRTGSAGGATGTTNNILSATFNDGVSDNVYVRANNGSTGNELYRIDTEPSLTLTLIEDISSGGASSSPPQWFYEFSNTLFFSAGDGPERDMYAYDGTNVTKPFDIRSASDNPVYLTEYSNTLFFSADDANGKNLYAYDGINSPTKISINGASSPDPQYLAVYSNTLFFSADGGDDAGRELWAYDATSNTTTRISDILTTGDDNSNPKFLTVYSNTLFFNADQGETKMFAYDGTNVSEPFDIYGGNEDPIYLTEYSNTLFFQASNGTYAEMYAYDGTNVSQPFDIRSGGSDSPYMNQLTGFLVANGNMYFSVNGGTTGSELWQYDGNEATLVQDYNESGSSNPLNLVALPNGDIFGSVDDGGTVGREWAFLNLDPTSAPELYNLTLEATRSESATFYVDVADGGATTTYTFDYGTASNNYSYSYSNTIAGNSATVNVGFEDTENLMANTQYFVRASATNSVTWTESDEISFWTLIEEPSQHPDFGQDGQENNTISLTFTAHDDLGADVDGYILLSSNVTITNDDLPNDSQTYSQGNSIGDATIEAIITSGSATVHEVTGLAQEKSFQFALIPYNEGDDPATTNYKTDNVPTVSGFTIPTLGEWGMMVFGGLMLVIGSWYVRRTV